MIENTAYVATETKWITSIPDHWNVKRLKYVTCPRKDVSSTGEEELLSVTEGRGIVRRRDIRSDDETLSRSDDLVGYRMVSPGDLVNNIMLVWKRGLGVSPFSGIVSPAYSVFKFDEHQHPQYFNYLLRSDEYIAEFRRNSTGITMSRLRLYDDSFGNVYAHVPPLDEQRLISRYLDKKTQQIDTLIEKIEKKIELLKEQRTSLINHYVTKGLDPNVEMKDSGVEWIGKIPKHWSISKVGRHFRLERGRVISNEEISLNVGPYPVFSSQTKLNGEMGSINTFDFEGEYVSWTTDGANAGTCFYRNGKFNVTNVCGLLSSFSTPIDYRFLTLFLNLGTRFYVRKDINPKLMNDMMAEIPLLVAPIEEQILISEHLTKKIDNIQRLSDREELRIRLLTELRQSLISSVVTGKVRVTEDMI